MSKNKVKPEDKKAITSLVNSLRYKKSGLGAADAAEVRTILQKLNERTSLPMQYLVTEGLKFAIENKPEFQRYMPDIRMEMDEERVSELGTEIIPEKI